MKPALFGYSSRTLMSGRTGLNPGLDSENIPHSAINIAAITGPMTKPLMPRRERFVFEGGRSRRASGRHGVRSHGAITSAVVAARAMLRSIPANTIR